MSLWTWLPRLLGLAKAVAPIFSRKRVQLDPPLGKSQAAEERARAEADRAERERRESTK